MANNVLNLNWIGDNVNPDFIFNALFNDRYNVNVYKQFLLKLLQINAKETIGKSFGRYAYFLDTKLADLDYKHKIILKWTANKIYLNKAYHQNLSDGQWQYVKNMSQIAVHYQDSYNATSFVLEPLKGKRLPKKEKYNNNENLFSGPYNWSVDDEVINSDFSDIKRYAARFRSHPGLQLLFRRFPDWNGTAFGGNLICCGKKWVIFSKIVGENYLIYRDKFDYYNVEIPVCHAQSFDKRIRPIFEKNWAPFDVHEDGTMKLIDNLFPLRILQLRANGGACEEVNVRADLPNINRIANRYNGGGFNIFRNTSRGIKWGDHEHIFVGHVTLHSKNGCFPVNFIDRNVRNSYSRQYFMFFYTVGKHSNGKYGVWHMSSCFQINTGDFRKITFAPGLCRTDDRQLVVTYGIDDKECGLTYIAFDDVKNMLKPVESWNVENYVFHSNYQNMLYALSRTSTDMKLMIDVHIHGNMKALCYMDTNSHGCFNASMAYDEQNESLIIVSRKLHDVRHWSGSNEMQIQIVQLKVYRDTIFFTELTEKVLLKIGISEALGEDPRVMMNGDDDALLFFNDVIQDGSEKGKRRMFFVGLSLPIDSQSGISKICDLCHSLSTKDIEKNWSPFICEDDNSDEHLFFVQNIAPVLQIGRINEDHSCRIENCTPLPLDLVKALKVAGVALRGGSAGIKITNTKYLFVGHGVSDRVGACFPDQEMQNKLIEHGADAHEINYPKLYTIFFYTIEMVGFPQVWRLSEISCCSHLPGKRKHYTKIVFPCGIVRVKTGLDSNKKSIIVSYGDSDKQNSYCVMTEEFLKYILRPVEIWNELNYMVDINLFENILTLNRRFHGDSVENWN